MLAERTFLDYTNLSSSNDYKKNVNFKDWYVKSHIFKKIDETRNYLLEEIEYNDLMSEKHKKTREYLNYVEHLLFLASTVTTCVSNFAFASLACVLVGITRSAVEIKIHAITAGVKV